MNYKKIAIIGTGGSYDNIPDPINVIKNKNYSVELIEPNIVNFPFTHFDRLITKMSYLDVAISAQKKGYDAVFINTFGDYGIDEMKSALDIVVVGAGEATMSLASNIARNFSIVTLWPPKLNFIYYEKLMSSNLEHKCVSVRNVLQDDNISGMISAGEAITSMNSNKSKILKNIKKEIHLAINEDGADSILLGCTCMAKVASDISNSVEIPILEPMTSGYKMVELLLSLGLKHSYYSFPKADSSHLDHVEKILNGEKDLDIGVDSNFCITNEGD